MLALVSINGMTLGADGGGSSSTIGAGGSRSTTSNSILVAVGLLSTAKKNTKANATVSLGRRAIIRQSNRLFDASLSKSVVVRFLIARNGKSLNSSSPVFREAEVEGDIIFLNMTEAKHRCALKYWLWFKLAVPMFPTARYFMLGDDDTFIQLDHLKADLDNVYQQTQDQHVLWGLIMWKAYYNNETMETSTGFTGWDFFDWAAVAQRRAMVLCRHMTQIAIAHGLPVNKSTAPGCYIIRNDHREAVNAGQMDPLPPFPYINGPLFGVSRQLATMLSASRYPTRWISQLGHNKQTIARAEKLWGFSCWPVGDSVLGFWVASVALKRQTSVTLVNSPFMGQHLPWPSWHFGNTSIVLHGLRTEKQNAFREEAIRKGSGAFEPYRRTCGSCQDMGWSTWPDSPLNRWRCCGKRLEPGRRVRACVGKQCPRVDKQTLLAVANAKNPPGGLNLGGILSPAGRFAAVRLDASSETVAALSSTVSTSDIPRAVEPRGRRGSQKRSVAASGTRSKRAAGGEIMAQGIAPRWQSAWSRVMLPSNAPGTVFDFAPRATDQIEKER